jgi:hypothetical protein
MTQTQENGPSNLPQGEVPPNEPIYLYAEDAGKPPHPVHLKKFDTIDFVFYLAVRVIYIWHVVFWVTYSLFYCTSIPLRCDTTIVSKTISCLPSPIE